MNIGVINKRCDEGGVVFMIRSVRFMRCFSIALIIVFIASCISFNISKAHAENTPSKTNLALGKSITASIAYGWIDRPWAVTDGNKDPAVDPVTNYTNIAAPGPQWIQIDLGSSYKFDIINVWHYPVEGRKYYDVIVQVSNDPELKTFTTVYNMTQTIVQDRA